MATPLPSSRKALRPMTAVEWSLLLLLALLWGGSFYFGAVALSALPPFSVAFCRVAGAALMLVAFAYARGLALPRSWAAWRPLLIMGLLNNLLPFSLILNGQREIASGLASILNATTPIFTLVFAHLFTEDERMTAPRLAGVLLGIAGVAAIVGPSALAEGEEPLLAELSVLAGAACYGLAGVYGRRFRGQPALVTAAGQACAASLFLLPLALFADRPFSLPPPGLEVVGALLGLAFFCTALAYLLYFRLLATAGATNLLLVTLLIPACALLLGVLLLDERLAGRHLLGLLVIALGLLVIDGRLLRRLGRQAA